MIDPVKAERVMDELRDALADLEPGTWCRYTSRISDAYVHIRPCQRHRWLEGDARIDWLSRVQSYADRVAAVLRVV